MSIQDESFPYEEELEFSHNSGKNFVFPHHKPRRSQILANKESIEDYQTSANEHNASTSLYQDDTTRSSNDLSAPAETSGKTNSSEPNDLQECDNKKSELKRHNPNKAVSYQDIHSEYTKRRYKHVESKVGQYIANIKALDEKRRNLGKFQRHRSLPETLHGTERNMQNLNTDSEKLDVLRRSTNDLDRMHVLQIDNNTENDDNLTDTTSSLSARDLGTEAGIFLDKQTYEQLLNDKERNDYLESKLEEKNAENWRLKQNLDTMRIEFTICRDKLKQHNQAQRFSGSFSSINTATVSTLGQTSLQSLLYSRETKEKATQTDRVLTPPLALPSDKMANEMFVTPLPSDPNNNSFDHTAVGIMAPAVMKVSKSIATIQPISLNFSNIAEQDSRELNISNNTIGFLRQRSNSIANRKKSTPLNNVNTSKASSASCSIPSSSDSAIDIEVCESPKNQREEFVYYDENSQCYAVLQTRNAGQSVSDGDVSSPATNALECRNKKNHRKRKNLRSRMMRFFGVCTKCEDPNNMSLDTIDNSNQQQSYSQIPLLEKSSQNNCRTVR